MQTRRKAKAAEASQAGFQNLLQNLHNTRECGASRSEEPQNDTLVDASKKDIGKLLQRVEERQSKVEKRQRNASVITDTQSYQKGRKRQKSAASGEDALFYQRKSFSGKLLESDFELLPSCGTGARTKVDPDPGPKGKRIDEKSADENASGTRLNEEEDNSKNCIKGSQIDVDEIGSDWEDAFIGLCGDRSSSGIIDTTGVLTIEIDNGTTSKQVKTQSVRRSTARDKEFAELVHKVHLLCLIGRGMLVNTACDDPLVKASLFSLVPAKFLDIDKGKKLTASMLTPLVKWFQSTFRVRSVDEGSSKEEKQETIITKLIHAIDRRSGKNEEIAALSVALFRVLGLTSRYVSILDVSSLKPDAESMDASAEWFSDTDDENGLSLYHMNKTRTTIASLGQVIARCEPQTSKSVQVTECVDSNVSAKGHCHTKTTQDLNGDALKKSSSRSNDINGRDVPMTEGSAQVESSCDADASKPLKRKGDLEYELQLAMALSATAAEAENKANNRESKNDKNCLESPVAKLAVRRGIKGSKSLVQQKTSTQWSRKEILNLHWAEVYCEGESLTGRWVHVDVANGIVDGEEKVKDASASSKRPVRYVIGFAGIGAKDITPRYVSKWSSIVKQRVPSEWWIATMNSLEELEASATAGVCKNSSECCDRDLCQSSKCTPPVNKIGDRRALEDMELRTRTLIEPLPTNQQAYKDHHLYVLERWLTKYQTLYPKGPVLGYCAGLPVYSRSSVQTLHTASSWLREGLQIRKGETPAKVVKSRKQLKQYASSPSNLEEESSQGGNVNLFGKWQTEPLQLPPAHGGIVPKNERGHVDVWSEKCLPPGTVHMRMQRLVPLVKKLGIDFAPAMVGFEVRNGRSVPMFDGIVVCEEFQSVILQAYSEEEARRSTALKQRSENMAILRWSQLLRSIATRQRLQDTYERGISTSGISFMPLSEKAVPRSDSGLHADASPPLCHDSRMQVMSSSTNQDVNLSVNTSETFKNAETVTECHSHTFPAENQSFNEESCIWTKWCTCGFAIQVEEM
eukprot:TRINITY_DN4959_c0_g1_i1.p1 TRINITY_DN4959_c0_g1~~TRINITY_DN4959_c0_g1_i1.p1  ORF type:complete len:1028 (+),score=241.22 TRINITY_DN4959_c0_g1_i1:204-3287(+)